MSKTLETYPCGIILSSHSLDRWNQRFSEYDLIHELSTLRDSSRAEREAIKEQCARIKSTGSVFSDRKTKISESNIVFIISDMNIVITMFGYIKQKKRSEYTHGYTRKGKKPVKNLGKYKR